MPVNSKVFESCYCAVLSPKVDEIFQKPQKYISFVQNYISNYKFHYQYEHCEDCVSHSFVTKFICSIIEILNSFRKQVLYYDEIVLYPIKIVSQLSEAIQICGDLINKLNKIEKVEKTFIIELLSFMKEIFDKWESYIFNNGILSFV